MKKNLFLFICTIFFYSLVSATINSCGFHIRNYQELPSTLKVLQITASDPHSSLQALLKKNFQGMGLILTSQAPVTLDILSENFTQSKNAIGTAQQLNTVTLYYTVTYVLKNPANQPIITPVTLTVTNNYLQNASQILGDISVTSSLQQEMMRTMSQKIFFQLGAKNTRDALSTLSEKR